MNELLDIEEKIKKHILIRLRELKTELFESSGQTLGRHWDDLSPNYKKLKKKAIGRAYPINIFTGSLLQSLIDDAISVETNYDENLDNMSFKINIDTDKIYLEYADKVNEKREYVSLSEEEKSFINELVNELVQEYLEGLDENG